MNLHFRVVFESRENYRVMNEAGVIFPAEIAGRIRNGASLWPAVGDWVQGRPQPGEWILIEEVRERKTLLSRRDPGSGCDQVLAANVDTLLVVTSANEELNLNRLDRYIALAVSGNVKPVIVINKIELCLDPSSLLDEIAARFGGVDIHGVSAHQGFNLEALQRYISHGETIALVGSSGVGKSSLTNCLLGELRMFVSHIREDDDRGRHTTTHRELHTLPSGAVIIDTPGLRQVGLIDETNLEDAFADISEYARSCRFTDCQHASEPGCAVQKVLRSGDLDANRWQSYIKLQKELAFERRKGSKALQSEAKKHWAKFSVAKRRLEKSRL